MSKSQFQKWFGVRQQGSTTGSAPGGRSGSASQSVAAVAVAAAIMQDAGRVLFDGPCHIVPSMSSLFDSFLSQSGGGRQGGADVDAAARFARVHSARTVGKKKRKRSASLSVSSLAVTTGDAMAATLAATTGRSAAAQDACVAEKLAVRLGGEEEERMMEWFKAEVFDEGQAVVSGVEEDEEVEEQVVVPKTKSSKKAKRRSGVGTMACPKSAASAGTGSRRASKRVRKE